MDLIQHSCFHFILLLVVSSLLGWSRGATFTFVNKCEYTVWPGVLGNTGTPSLGTTGFDLPTQTTRTFPAPTAWSGRFWARTGCTFDNPSDSDNIGFCTTGDCGSGTVECNGAGAEPPATLAEFTLASAAGTQDFYDVSLVDGYNVPVLVEARGGSGLCASTGCVVDLNGGCPAELRVGDGDACKSACEAFGRPEYCCSGAYATPATCRPSVYSEMFKSACPRSYSYAYDDATSTFTCTAADYTITFCPITPSQKSSRNATPVTSATPVTTPDVSGSDPTGSSPSSIGSGYMTYGSVSYNGGTTTTAMQADGTWLAGLAMGASSKPHFGLVPTSVIFTIISYFLLL